MDGGHSRVNSKRLLRPQPKGWQGSVRHEACLHAFVTEKLLPRSPAQLLSPGGLPRHAEGIDVKLKCFVAGRRCIEVVRGWSASCSARLSDSAAAAYLRSEMSPTPR